MPASNRRPQSGFTYIEMLVVIALMALCFVPLLQMFARSMNEVDEYSRYATAAQLGEEAMESIKNLRWTEAQIQKKGEEWLPPQDKPPVDLNHGSWRIKRWTLKGTDPLEIHVEVFDNANLTKPVVQLVSLIEDL